MKTRVSGPVLESEQKPVDLGQLPVITSWHSDGGPFVTLPLVYTEHPETRKHNLGMYRMQIHGATRTRTPAFFRARSVMPGLWPL